MREPAMSVRVASVSKRFGDTPALDRLEVEIRPGSFTVITGPPKSGKSTLFRVLVGLETPDRGRILLDGDDITAASPTDRRLGYVPQSFALYPHLRVRDNIGYPLALARADREHIRERVAWAADLLSIGHLLDKTPDQLSGGEKQRTAVARGLLARADVFVFDDPLVGLDYKLRERLMEDLKALRRELDATFVYATADSVEALTLATDLVVLDGGRVIQAGPTEAVYLRPSSARAMELVGFPRANLLPGRIENERLRAGPIGTVFPGQGDIDVLVGIRPEAVRLARSDIENEALELSASVSLIEDLGSEIVVYADVDGTSLTAAFAVGDAMLPSLGDSIPLAIDPASIVLFDAADGTRLDAAGARA